MSKKQLFYKIYQLEPTQIIIEKRNLVGQQLKFWYNDKVPNRVRTEREYLGKCLFKESRPANSASLDARTDWAEKVVYEITKLLDLPSARYEFGAGYLGDPPKFQEGIISVNCVPINGKNQQSGKRFLMGILGSDYKYTVGNVLYALNLAEVRSPSDYQIDGIKSGAETFVGYLLLDCLTNNTDRHVGNWELIRVEGKLELLPTYDHGTSLGSIGSDNQKRRIISSLADNINQINRCPFVEEDRGNYLSTFDAFNRAAKLYPEAAQIWIEKLRAITLEQINEIFERIPEGRITPTAATFAKALLEYNQAQILNLDLELIQPQLDEQAILTAIETLKQEVREISNLTTIDFDEDNLSYMRDFVVYRSTKDHNNLQPAIEYADELDRRLFKAIEDDISIFSGYILDVKYLIEEKMSDEGLVNPLFLDDSDDGEDSDK
jgi:hypothetical protein